MILDDFRQIPQWIVAKRGLTMPIMAQEKRDCQCSMIVELALWSENCTMDYQR